MRLKEIFADPHLNHIASGQQFEDLFPNSAPDTSIGSGTFLFPVRFPNATQTASANIR